MPMCGENPTMLMSRCRGVTPVPAWVVSSGAVGAVCKDLPVHAEQILAAIPDSLHDLAGAVLYSGLDSWTRSSSLYVLGFNPGGVPDAHSATVAESVAWMMEQPGDHSAYRDQEWGNGRGGMWRRGRHPMQRSVVGLFDRLDIDPGTVPASNTFYASSRNVEGIAVNDARAWQEACWPFHAEMIERLQIRVVLCMGRDAANFVRSKVGSNQIAATFVEDNNRRNKSYIYTGGSVTVVDATHPSRFPWYSNGCDIAPLVAQALAGA